MVRNAKRNVVIVGKDQAGATFVSCTANTTPITVTVATIDVVIDDQQRFLAL